MPSVCLRLILKESVDHISAHQGFTGPGGHPMELVGMLAGVGILPAGWATTHGEGDALFAVTSEQDVDRAWPRLIGGHPDFIKVFLVHSEETARSVAFEIRLSQ